MQDPKTAKYSVGRIKFNACYRVQYITEKFRWEGSQEGTEKYDATSGTVRAHVLICLKESMFARICLIFILDDDLFGAAEQRNHTETI